MRLIPLLLGIVWICFNTISAFGELENALLEHSPLSLCEGEWFEQDLELFKSDKWQNTWASSISGDKHPIQTLIANSSKYPFYRYDLTFENVSIDFIYRIEGPNYAKEVKHWIPQTIEGFTVNCSTQHTTFCPQYISFSFSPTPFSDRDVCQIVCPTKSDEVIHLSVRTVPFKYCSISITSDLVHMEEFVAKFIWKEDNKVYLTYLGMEDPKGNFPVWFMKATYPWAYRSHVSNYIKYVKGHHAQTY